MSVETSKPGAEFESYSTIRKDSEFTAEITEKKSRFIAHLKHVSSEAKAAAHLEEVRANNHDARHNVPAWILADGRERCSDDGEPSRTAGMPVLEVLRGAELKDVSCVVTRYFGGTLLGPGGLVRAYTQAAQAALALAQEQDGIVRMELVVRAIVDIPYSLYDKTTRLIADCGGKVHDSVFAEDVQLTASFLSGSEMAFVEAMRELSAGEDLVRVSEPAFAEF